MSQRQLMGRRQFLIVSSTCAVAAATVGPKLFAAGTQSSPKRLAVGFATFEDSVRVTPASSISSSDGGFISRGARVTVSGASGASADPMGRRAVELKAHYSFLEGSERVEAPFYAWAGSRRTGNQGNNVSFNVPVDELQQLRFSMLLESGKTTEAVAASRRKVLAGAQLASVDTPVTLGLQRQEGSLLLNRGYYVLVPLFENDSEPRWSAFRIDQANGRMSLVDSSGDTAPFEHFVLGIDYAV